MHALQVLLNTGMILFNYDLRQVMDITIFSSYIIVSIDSILISGVLQTSDSRLWIHEKVSYCALIFYDGL
jgi:hypothetical protein